MSGDIVRAYPPQTQRFHSIQCLRAIAALMVLIFHMHKSLWLGPMGVDIFFVISGFIIGQVNQQTTPIDFLAKRAIRIIPLYWFVTLFYCSLSLFTKLLPAFSFTVPRLMESLLFIPNYDSTGHIWPLVVPGWSLNYEVFFYVLFAAGLAFNRPLQIVATVIGILTFAGLIWGPKGAFAQTYTNSLMLEFVMGLAGARFLPLIPKIHGRWISLILLASGALGIAVNVWLGAHDDSWRLALWESPQRCWSWGLSWPKRRLAPFHRYYFPLNVSVTLPIRFTSGTEP